MGVCADNRVLGASCLSQVLSHFLSHCARFVPTFGNSCRRKSLIVCKPDCRWRIMSPSLSHKAVLSRGAPGTWQRLPGLPIWPSGKSPGTPQCAHVGPPFCKRVPDQYHFTVLNVLFRTFPLPSVPQNQLDRLTYTAWQS